MKRVVASLLVFVSILAFGYASDFMYLVKDGGVFRPSLVKDGGVWRAQLSAEISEDKYSEVSTAFDGVDERVDTVANNSFSLGATASFSFWAKADDWTPGVIKRMFGSYDGGNLIDGDIMFLLDDRVGKDRFVLQFGTGASAGASYEITSLSTKPLTNGEWHHFVFICDTGAGANEKLKMFIDGVQYNATNIGDDDSGGTIGNNADTFTIGSGSGAGVNFPWEGNIDDLCVWNHKFTLSEAQEAYNSGSTFDMETHSQSANLKAYWKMGDGDTHPTIVDHISSNNGTMVNMTSGNFESDTP